MRRVVVVVACVVGVLWLAPVSPAARAAPGPVQAVAGSAASGATGGRSVLADFNDGHMNMNSGWGVLIIVAMVVMMGGTGWRCSP